MFCLTFALQEKVKNFDGEMEREKSRSLALETSLKEKEDSWSDLEGKLKGEAEQQKQRYTGNIFNHAFVSVL